jgi:hypothetical protein
MNLRSITVVKTVRCVIYRRIPGDDHYMHLSATARKPLKGISLAVMKP